LAAQNGDKHFVTMLVNEVKNLLTSAKEGDTMTKEWID
jgi:hypothetical protein